MLHSFFRFYRNEWIPPSVSTQISLKKLLRQLQGRHISISKKKVVGYVVLLLPQNRQSRHCTSVLTFRDKRVVFSMFSPVPVCWCSFSFCQLLYVDSFNHNKNVVSQQLSAFKLWNKISFTKESKFLDSI